MNKRNVGQHLVFIVLKAIALMMKNVLYNVSKSEWVLYRITHFLRLYVVFKNLLTSWNIALYLYTFSTVAPADIA